MTHDRIQDLLEDYVDERLDRPTRKEVDQHLKDCAECRSVLDGVASVDLGPLDGRVWNEATMRRAVRRSLLRTAANAVVIGLVGWLALTIVAALVFQPLLVNRGGRAQAATVATADLAVMFNPGASLTGWEYSSGLLSRTSSATVVSAVGADLVELGTVESRLGLTSFGGVVRGPLGSLSDQVSPVTLSDRLAAVGEGTVASVVVLFDEPLTLSGAQDLVEGGTADVRIVWAGFATPTADAFGPVGLGYTTCGTPSVQTGSSGGGAGGSSGFALPADVGRAHAELVRAVANLVAHPELTDPIAVAPTPAGGWADISSELTANPAVRSLVVTGPTAEVVHFIESAGADSGMILDIDFTNWFAPLCGK